MTVSSIIGANGPNHGSKNARLRDELRELLLRYNFTHFITLATNHQPYGDVRMRRLLKEWDARVNRDLNGPKWLKRPDERLVWFAFPEKFDVNAHWHLLAEVDQIALSRTRKSRLSDMPGIARKHWLQLVPQASFDCKRIDSAGIIRYVTKVSSDPKHFNSFVAYREFTTC